MLREALRRFHYWLASNRNRAELEEEMRLHLALRAEQLEARGLPGREAELEARRRFGDTLRLAELSRERWVPRWLDDLMRDARIGWRGLRRSPGFTVVVVITLALGIGANGAIFQLVDVLGLRPLSVPNPRQLMLVHLADQKGWRGSQASPLPTLTNLQWEYLRDQQDVFSGVVAWSANIFGYGADPTPVRGLFVSGDFFQVLGVPPVQGGVFRAEDDHRGCGVPGAVLSYGFWQSELAGDPAVVGRTITLNDQTVPIVGVVGPSFTGAEVGNGFDLAVPICSQATLWNAGNWLDEGAVWWLTVLGRQVEGHSHTETNARLGALSRELFAATLTPAYPRENAADYLRMQLVATPAPSGVSDLRDRYASPLILLLAATGLVLLLTSANLGNMVLARAATRAHEFGLRLSIGASRASLLRQLLVENALLALVGAVAGFGVANVLSRLLVWFLGTANGALVLDLRPTGTWIAFSLAVTIACCAVFGLLPAWRVSRADPSDVLHATRRVTDAAGSGASLRKLLVVTQVAVSLVLVFGALLFLHTLTNVLTVDPGFDRRGVVTSWIDFSRLAVPVESRATLRHELLEAIRGTPGVTSAAEVSPVPLTGSGGTSTLWLEGSDRGHGLDANTQLVSPGYFETMGIPHLAGRDFDVRDGVGSLRVAVVNQTLVRQLQLGPNPIGKRLRKEANPWDPEHTIEVIGVVRDTKYASLKDDFEPTAFYTLTQDADPPTWVQHVIRSQTPGASIEADLRAVLKSRYPALSVDFRRLETTVADGLLRERLLAVVSGFLGGLAALIAAVGLYGVIAYLVTRRTNEIGIRLALGATKGHIVATVGFQTLVLVFAGMAIGLVGALLAGQATKAMLYGLGPWDLTTLGAAVVVLLLVAVAAGFLPARRAASLDPLMALRQE